MCGGDAKTNSRVHTRQLRETARVSEPEPWTSVVAAFDAAWKANWPTCRPIGHELRTCAAWTWVRFHSLPGSKRYADSEAEYAELLTRHVTVLSDLGSLAASSTAELVIITAAWSGSEEHADRAPDLKHAFPAATPWRTILYDDTYPDDPIWTHLHLRVAALDSAACAQLLRLVADDETGDVIISDRRARWLYHPYDGGGDVLAPSEDARDALKTRYRDWLPTNPLGL
jgi:hypothetical protein